MHAPVRGSRPPLALLAALVAACSTEPSVRTPSQLEIVGGQNQTGSIGAVLSGKIRVRARDAEGPLSGVTITVAVESQGGGSVTPTSLTTGSTGEAEATWTLGSKVGIQTLTFTTQGVTPATASATASPGTGSLIFQLSTGFQLTVVEHAVSEPPRVRVTDLFGNNVTGATVVFETEGGGSATGATQTTGADGTATVGSWTIGRDAIPYVLRARIPGGLSAMFQAQGIPATLTAVAGNGLTANAGTAVSAAPAIRAAREDGSPLSSVLVNFVVTGGGGTLQGTSALTASDGIARATRWIMGPTPGPNGVEARVIGKTPVPFLATGVAATAANATAASLSSQSGFFGNFVPAMPAVTVTDASGNPVAGTTVNFQITQGDGVLTGTTRTTDFDGIARVESWRLGNATTHTVQATSSAFAPVNFNATAGAVPPSSLTIEVRYVTTGGALTPTPAQQAAFDQAVARWRQVLVAGNDPYLANEPSFCPLINETVPGTVIFAKLQPIDGVGGILGQAGPCIVRDAPGHRTAVGLMSFDTADLNAIEAKGQLGDVILHEMAHVLGFGILWNFLNNSLLAGQGGGDPHFTGSSARGAFYSSVVGNPFTGNAIPVENSGGPGTRDSHWRETTFDNELMTGFLNGVSRPLSAFTAASFRDFGYQVNDAVADPYTLQMALQEALQPLPSVQGSGFQLIEAPIPGPILVIDRQGRVVRRVARQ
jgi:hypothetical protein